MPTFAFSGTMLDEQLKKNIALYLEESLVDGFEDIMTCGELAPGLEDSLGMVEEGFSDRLFHMIHDKGLDEVDVYKRANLSRQLFSKIRSRRDYQPSKATVLCLSLAMHLNLDETDSLLESAGFALSHSSRSDIIVEYFITNGEWNLFTVNEALDAFGEEPLGL